MAIMTPQQLWENYDRKTPAMPTVLQEIKITQRTMQGEDVPFLERRLYFNGFSAQNTVVRVYARLLIPTGKKKAKHQAVIVADEFGSDIESSDAARLLGEDYAILLVDYSGKSDSKLRYTLYPKTINASWEASPESVMLPPDDPKDSCWFYWATCILHAITFLESCEEIDGDNIGILGIAEGGALVWKASRDPSIKAGATFFGGDLLGTGPQYLAYKAALDSRAYTKNCFPILVNAATNEKNGAFDYLSELCSSSQSAYFCAHERADRATSDAQRSNLKLWFDCFLKNSGKSVLPAEKPNINVFCSEGILYAELIAECESAQFFTAEDMPPAFRNWNVAPAQRLGGGRFLCKLDAHDAAAPLHVFATVSYEGGLTLSSSLTTRVPQKLGARAAETLRPNRLLYQSDAGAGAWQSQNGGLLECGTPEMAEGPLGLKGVYGDELTTFKPGDARFRGGADSLIQIILYSPVQEVEISIITLEDGLPAVYKAKRRFTPLDWATITLSGDDFKSIKGTPSLDRAVALSVKGERLIINSVIWI